MSSSHSRRSQLCSFFTKISAIYLKGKLLSLFLNMFKFELAVNCCYLHVEPRLWLLVEMSEFRRSRKLILRDLRSTVAFMQRSWVQQVEHSHQSCAEGRFQCRTFPFLWCGFAGRSVFLTENVWGPLHRLQGRCENHYSPINMWPYDTHVSTHIVL